MTARAHLPRVSTLIARRLPRVDMDVMWNEENLKKRPINLDSNAVLWQIAGTTSNNTVTTFIRFTFLIIFYIILLSTETESLRLELNFKL